jgi:hypothetical protein
VCLLFLFQTNDKFFGNWKSERFFFFLRSTSNTSVTPGLKSISVFSFSFIASFFATVSRFEGPLLFFVVVQFACFWPSHCVAELHGRTLARYNWFLSLILRSHTRPLLLTDY